MSKPLLKNLKNLGNLKEAKRQSILDAKTKIFGYAKGLPGEKQWLKPLQGRSYANWYFPSRYLMPHFHVEHYFQMQVNRFTPKPSHPSMQQLTDCLDLIVKNKEIIKQFFTYIDKQTFINSSSLQDLYSLYRTVDDTHILSFEIDESIWKANGFSWFKMEPENGLALLESELNKEDPNEFENFFKTSQNMKSISELENLIENKLKNMQIEMKNIVQLHSTERIPYVDFSMDKSSVITNSKDKYMTIQPIFESENENIKKKVSSDDIITKKLNSDENLKKFYKKRIRFFDGLFHRKRNAFLDKLNRNKIKSEKERDKYGGKLYKLHPNLHEVWPQNKGISSRQWPSPYH